MRQYMCLSCGYTNASSRAVAKHRCEMPERGVVQDCTCRRARHEHGTVGAYAKDGCRCEKCRLANRVYDRWKASRTPEDRVDDRVDSSQAHDIIVRARSDGVSIPMLADAVGLGHEVLRRIVNKPGCLIDPYVHDVLVAADIKAIARARNDVGIETVLPYLHSLYALGWSSNDIARHSDIPTDAVRRYTRAECRRISTDRAKAIRRTYLDLSLSRPEQMTEDRQRALARARANGWKEPNDDGVPTDLAEESSGLPDMRL